MAKAMFFLLVVILLGAGGDRYIPWGSGYKLHWDDFSGEVDESSNFEALAYSKISMNWDCEQGRFIFHAISKFDKEKSWKKERLSEALLAHEQLHFDLAEVYARRMRQHFATTPDPCSLSNEEIAAQGEAYIAEWREREALYDAETNHSKDKVEQARWATMVATELKSLAKYALPAD